MRAHSKIPELVQKVLLWALQDPNYRSARQRHPRPLEQRNLRAYDDDLPVPTITSVWTCVFHLILE